MLVEQKHTQSKGGWWLHPFIEHLVSQAHFYWLSFSLSLSFSRAWLAVKMVGRPSHPKLPLWHLYCGVTAKADGLSGLRLAVDGLSGRHAAPCCTPWSSQSVQNAGSTWRARSVCDTRPALKPW